MEIYKIDFETFEIVGCYFDETEEKEAWSKLVRNRSAKLFAEYTIENSEAKLTLIRDEDLLDALDEGSIDYNDVELEDFGLTADDIYTVDEIKAGMYKA